MMVYEKSREEEALREMGTTLDVILIIKEKIYIGHVGDSKVYKINNSQIDKLTTDHSYVEKLVKDGTITRQEAITHPKRNMLLKAIGSNTFVSPDIIDLEVQNGDIFLMCSDGLTNMVSENRILEIISKYSENSVEYLIEEANNSGGIDNITTIIIEKIT